MQSALAPESRCLDRQRFCGAADRRSWVWIARWLVGAVATVLAVGSTAAASAKIQLFNLSFRFQPAVVRVFGQDYRLSLTTGTRRFDPANGELSPVYGTSAFTHGGWLVLETPQLFEPLVIPFVLNIPAFVDANTNDVHDFFEVSGGFNGVVTTGRYFDEFVFGEGQLRATWTRAADTRTGTCQLELEDFPSLVFVHPFELTQFDGTLLYAVSGRDITGSVDLKQKLNESVILGGAARLQRISADELLLLPGTWVTPINEQFPYDGIQGITRRQTRYLSTFHFTDGDLTTDWEDYALYAMVITDPNDADRDGIPDLSDVPSARLPLLSLRRQGEELALTLSGEPGRVHEIQSTTSLASPTWQRVLSLTLTNDPQVLRLPLPERSPTFYRARVP